MLQYIHTTPLGVWELISVAQELLSLFDVPWNKNEGIQCCGHCWGTRHSRRYHINMISSGVRLVSHDEILS